MLSTNIYDRIEINPKVMMGEPVIQEKRLPVELILRKLSEKATEADLLQAYSKNLCFHKTPAGVLNLSL